MRRNLVGIRSGRLQVIQFDHTRYAGTRRAEAMWRCRCDCGEESVVRANSITRQTVKSCGCVSPTPWKHGGCNLPEYRVWRSMVGRCHHRGNTRFQSYGGRGITVCQRWRDNFAHFLADMGPRPSQAHSIDRIDNDRGYEAANCRWATAHEQVRNTRRNHYIEVNGERATITDWSRRLGINVSTLVGRYRRLGAAAIMEACS